MSNAPLRSFGSPASSPSFIAALEKVLAQQSGRVVRLVRTGAMASALAVTAGPLLAGCNPPADLDDLEGELAEADGAILGGGQTDWAQQQGQRNTQMVSYYGQSWYTLTDCGMRGGCQGIDLFLKLRVKPVAGANLDQKRVGVVYRKPGTSELFTVTGTYFTTWGNGDEEWHVKVNLRSWENVVSFNAWYQDGTGSTFHDDNGGELHAVAVGAASAIQHNWGYTTVALTEQGVQGNISVRIADLDWDKQVSIVWTTDDWQTANWSHTGAGPNDWHWAEDIGEDFERWEIQMNIPGNFQSFKYAIVYKHGTVPGATVYEFWDNNGGQNYVVVRQ